VANNPTIRRWELGSHLRRLRESAGLSLDDVARELLCSPSKVSRIETAARTASLRDVRDLCQLYNVDSAEREHLMRLARESKQAGWWRNYDEVPSRYATYIALEDAATSIQQYAMIRIPGLLQTPDYARAVLRRNVPRLGESVIEQYIMTRQERKRVLTKDDAPTYWAILDEAVLQREVGGAKVMREQMQHLVEQITEQHVVLQIVPFSAGAHAGMDNSFTVLEFKTAQIPDVVYVEALSGHLFLNRDQDLRLHHEVLDHLRAAALSPDASLDLLHGLADRMGV
jgi:transcriptional regulator with XRE-family HTH domain